MKKISITEGPLRTSVSLEPEFQNFLDKHAAKIGTSFVQLTRDARKAYPTGTLSSALRRHALALALRAEN